MGIDYQQFRDSHEPRLKMPFSSSRKRMSVVLEHEGALCLFTKGASEMILESCT